MISKRGNNYIYYIYFFFRSKVFLSVVTIALHCDTGNLSWHIPSDSKYAYLLWIFLSVSFITFIYAMVFTGGLSHFILVKVETILMLFWHCTESRGHNYCRDWYNNWTYTLSDSSSLFTVLFINCNSFLWILSIFFSFHVIFLSYLCFSFLFFCLLYNSISFHRLISFLSLVYM